MTGLVYKSTGSWYTVKSEQGDWMPYEREIWIKGIKSTNPIAVGDVGLWTRRIFGYSNGTIHNIHERKNYIVRNQWIYPIRCILLSNIDRVFLLITINNPPTTFNFIDRFLVTAEAYGIETILVLIKLILLMKDLGWTIVYAACVSGNWYKCLRVSSTEMKGVEQLKDDW
jgi:ribosome biogenesis GTPase